MEFQEFLHPVDLDRFGEKNHPRSLGSTISVYKKGYDFPDLEGVRIALIGVEDDRNTRDNSGAALAADHVRTYFYKLFPTPVAISIADLGNIRAGYTISDTCFALSSVAATLIKKNIIPVIIGGGQWISYANYLAYQAMEQTINLVSVDSGFDLGESEDELTSDTWLGKIILHQPNFLFNFSNIGYQTYFVDPTTVDLMSKLNFDVHRLGQVRQNLEEAEPVIRNADMVSFDLSAIRQSDAPGNVNCSPNGFYGEEACRIARYSGISDKLSSFGIYELNPAFDESGRTAHLVAQMIWYFIEGVTARKMDYPFTDKAEYLKYRVFVKDHKHEIVFFKSNRSDRWWMEVPYPVNQKLKFERHHLVPCSYADYATACKEEMPDRWWQTYQKLS